jgi:FdhE protein
MQELRGRNSSGSEVLTLYGHILALQQRMGESLEARSPSDHRQDTSLRAQLDIETALSWMPSMLEIVQKQGPIRLAEEARQVSTAGPAEQRQILADFLRDEQPTSYAPSSFFARAVFQPCADFLASRLPPPTMYSGALCPMCGSRPQLAVLRPEGDGGKRSLACSLCLTEWEFRRILCPVCEEMDPTKLPRYSAEDPIAVRVDACDTCKSYLKSFDMTVDGLMVPEVDEIATVALDVWAAAHGYHKFQLNLLGF